MVDSYLIMFYQKVGNIGLIESVNRRVNQLWDT